VPGLPAVDVVDLQLAVDPAQAGPAAVEVVRSGLDAAGYLRTDAAGDAVAGGEWWHAGADPGRPVRLAVRVAGSAAWRAALLWRDWLRADEEARSAYRTAVADGRPDEAASAREFTRAEEWAASSGWTPSLEELPGPR
jgi:dephospho-CoA kinase